MSLIDLLPAVRQLSRDEKLSLAQMLAEELNQGDLAALIPQGVGLPVWSPLECYEAAAQLMKLLEAAKDKP